MANSLFGNLFSGATTAYGYDQGMKQVDDQQNALRTNADGTSGGQLGQIEQNIKDQGSFKGYSVTSSLGNSGYDPATGQMTNQLNDTQQGYMDQQGQGAAEMYGRAMQDPAQRETEIYERMRAMQRPGEQRQTDSMNAGLFGSGRGGMSSDSYGGAPEQYANSMAQAEARNQASFGAMNQAQSEMQNYANIGQSMFNNQYVPGQEMQGFTGQALQNSATETQSRGNQAGLLAQTGIGGITTDVNYANVRGDMMTGLFEALGNIAGGGGDALQKFIDSLG
jgi:hypothetical protein